MQRIGEWTVGRDRYQVDAVLSTGIAKHRFMLPQPVQIGGSQRPRIDSLLSRDVLEIAKLNSTGKGEIDLVRIQNLKKQHFVA
jgi:hypothetical protein